MHYGYVFLLLLHEHIHVFLLLLHPFFHVQLMLFQHISISLMIGLLIFLHFLQHIQHNCLSSYYLFGGFWDSLTDACNATIISTSMSSRALYLCLSSLSSVYFPSNFLGNWDDLTMTTEKAASLSKDQMGLVDSRSQVTSKGWLVLSPL